MAELEVIIGGDSRDLAKEIDKVEKELKNDELILSWNVYNRYYSPHHMYYPSRR